MLTTKWVKVFRQCINDYHHADDIDASINNPYPKNSLESLMYKKNWIDNVQWHLEDIIRDPEVGPKKALLIKRRIDASNQERTDLVESIDNYFLNKFKHIVIKEYATHNTESPAWAIDRLSILELKIYHMEIEANRIDSFEQHRQQCNKKLDVLLSQHRDLTAAIDELFYDIVTGNKFMKVYKQMKMYNDSDLNPVLYQKHNS